MGLDKLEYFCYSNVMRNLNWLAKGAGFEAKGELATPRLPQFPGSEQFPVILRFTISLVERRADPRCADGWYWRILSEAAGPAPKGIANSRLNAEADIDNALDYLAASEYNRCYAHQKGGA